MIVTVCGCMSASIPFQMHENENEIDKVLTEVATLRYA